MLEFLLQTDAAILELFFGSINLVRFNDPSVVKTYAGADQATPCESYLFNKYINSNHRILEMGVGGGRLTNTLVKLGREYIGIDYAEQMVKACQEKYFMHDFRCMDARDLTAFPSSHFDVLVFSNNGLDCLPSLEDRHSCLQECKRVLKPGGILIFSSHNARYIFHVPVLKGALLVKKVWRIFLSAKISFVQLQKLMNKSFWRGAGYIYDPADGGLNMFYASRSYLEQEADEHGFLIREIKPSIFPRRTLGQLSVASFYLVLENRVESRGLMHSNLEI